MFILLGTNSDLYNDVTLDLVIERFIQESEERKWAREAETEVAVMPLLGA